MTRNYGIRYPYGGNNSDDNYGAWLPLAEIDEFLNIDKNKDRKSVV